MIDRQLEGLMAHGGSNEIVLFAQHRQYEHEDLPLVNRRIFRLIAFES